MLVRQPEDRLDHLELLRVEAGRMRAALAAAEPDASVPACPGWSVADLGEHLGRVHRWAVAGVGATERPAGGDYPPADRDGAPFADWYAGCAAELLSVLERTDPADPAWTFDRRDRTAGFWRRRQTHETLVHRVDAEQAVGRSFLREPDDGVDGLTTAVAEDGVDEVLTVFMPRWLHRRRSEAASDVYPLTRPMSLVLADTGRSWTVRLDGPRLDVRDGVHDPSVTVSAPAAVVYLALWGRAPRTLLEVAGDRDLGADLLHRAFTP